MKFANPRLLPCLALVLSGGLIIARADETNTNADVKAQQEELSALLMKAAPNTYSPIPPAPRHGEEEFSPYLAPSENKRLLELLRDPAVSKVVTRELALAAIKQRQLDHSLGGFQFDALMDIVNARWRSDPVVIAFYREALETRGDTAVSDLWSPQPGIWDDSLVEPVVRLIERAATNSVKEFVIGNALMALDGHYDAWATNASIPPRLSKAVLEDCSNLTNTLVRPQLGLGWCNSVQMLAETHDPAMVCSLRPFLKQKDLAYDPGGLGDGFTTMRICDEAAEAINQLLDLKINFRPSDMYLIGGHDVFTNGTTVTIWQEEPKDRTWSGYDPAWKDWDEKIADMEKRLDALDFTNAPRVILSAPVKPNADL